MPKDRFVVVGASLAGLRAAEAARRAGFDEDLTLIGAEAHLPYDRPPLSKSYLDDASEGPPEFRSADQLAGDLGIDLRLGSPVTGLDVAGRAVHAAGERVRFTHLVIATGASPRPSPIATDLHGVHALRTLDDAAAIRSALDAGARTVVIGAGFIGSEVASAARKRGLDVTVVETLPVPLVRSVGEQVGRVCAELHESNGTDLRCGTTVTAIEGDRRVERVSLDDGSVVPADLVVVGTGVSPATQWLRGSGIELRGSDGAVVCDDTLNAGQPSIYAAGDVTCWPHPLFDGHLMRLEHWTNAAEQGQLAAENALDPSNASVASAVPYFWSDWYGSRIQFVGTPHSDETEVISDSGDRFLAVYRRGDRMCGALTINRPTQIMKFRRLIAQRATWEEGRRFAREKR